MIKHLKGILALIGLMVSVTIFIGSSSRLILELQFPGWGQEIEQLRSDYKKDNNEYISAQVAEMNREIVSWKKYRQMWWSKYFVPSGVDNLKIIEIGRQ